MLPALQPKTLRHAQEAPISPFVPTRVGEPTLIAGKRLGECFPLISKSGGQAMRLAMRERGLGRTFLLSSGPGAFVAGAAGVGPRRSPFLSQKPLPGAMLNPALKREQSEANESTEKIW